jgi:hypothetical protein
MTGTYEPTGGSGSNNFIPRDTNFSSIIRTIM